MDKVQAARRRARFLRIEELYRSGLTMKEIGRRLEPPITPQRVGDLLREGAKRGLYRMPTLHRDSAAHALQSAEDPHVLEVLMNTKSVAATARALGFSRNALMTRYAHLVREMRKDGPRQRVIADYRDVAARLGYNPTTSQVGTNIVNRIATHFGSFSAFCATAGIVPRYNRKTRERSE